MIRFIVEMDDLVAFNQHFLSSTPAFQSNRKRSVATIAIALGILAIFRALSDKSYAPLVVWAIITPPLCLWIYRRSGKVSQKKLEAFHSPERDKLVLCEHEMENLPDGFIDITPLSENKIKFPAIIKIDETADHVFIFTGSNQAHIIPKARLSAGDLAAFVARLREGLQASPQRN